MHSKSIRKFLSSSTLSLFCVLNSTPILAKSPRAYLTAKSAIESGNLDKLKAALKGKFNINFTDKYSDSTLLIVAVDTQQIEIVRFLLENNANPNSKGLMRTPLSIAISKNNYEIFDLLLAHKADVNLAGTHGYAPLHSAVHNNDERFIVRLLSLGANPNIMTPRGQTPLMEWPYGNAAQRLIEAGAKVNLANRDGDTALMNASGGIPDTVRALIAAGANVNAANRNGDTALIAAAACGQAGIVKQLLQAGGDLYQANKDGISAENTLKAPSGPENPGLSSWCAIGQPGPEADYESTMRIINEFKNTKNQESQNE